MKCQAINLPTSLEARNSFSFGNPPSEFRNYFYVGFGRLNYKRKYGVWM